MKDRIRSSFTSQPQVGDRFTTRTTMQSDSGAVIEWGTTVEVVRVFVADGWRAVEAKTLGGGESFECLFGAELQPVGDDAADKRIAVKDLTIGGETFAVAGAVLTIVGTHHVAGENGPLVENEKGERAACGWKDVRKPQESAAGFDLREKPQQCAAQPVIEPHKPAKPQPRVYLSEVLKELPPVVPPAFWVQAMTTDATTVLAGEHEGTWDNLLRHCMTVGRATAKKQRETVVVLASVDGMPCYAVRCEVEVC